MPDSPLTDSQRADLLRLRDVLESKTGLYIPDDKLARLKEPSEHLESLGRAHVGEILDAIESGAAVGAHYLAQLVAAVATNETYFFRTAAHFTALKDYLVPELIEKKRGEGARTLRIWSAGCSTGEEAYSIAILLVEHFPELLSWDLKILATDIDVDALASASEAVYRPWSFRGVGPELMRKYWRELDGERYRVAEPVRSLVTFEAHNLFTDGYPFPANGTREIDVIFCRNVTIYFRPQTIRRVVEKFHDFLGDGGFLVTGAAEYSRDAYRDLEARVFPDSVVYQKPAPRPAAPKSFPLPLIWPEPPRRAARRRETPHGNNLLPPKPAETDAVDQAMELIGGGEIDAALVLLAEAAEKSPRDARIPSLIGRLAADRQHLSEAGYWLGRALALDPLNLWAHYFMALLWIEENKLDEALGALKKTIYIDPNFALGHFYLGRIHKAQGRSAQARKSFAVAKHVLAASPASEHLSGADGISGGQVLVLVERELVHDG
jgi:chemotaxis protein methyltransferase CheR